MSPGPHPCPPLSDHRFLGGFLLISWGGMTPGRNLHVWAGPLGLHLFWPHLTESSFAWERHWR